MRSAVLLDIPAALSGGGVESGELVPLGRRVGALEEDYRFHVRFILSNYPQVSMVISQIIKQFFRNS